MTAYCPACRGRGTNIHECVEFRSVVVRASDVKHILDVFIDNGMVEEEDEDIINRLYHAVIEAQAPA